MRSPVNISYLTAKDSCNTGDLYLPEPAGTPPDGALLIHGGGWGSMEKNSMAGVAEFLRGERNLAVFNVDYRLCGEYPWPTGGEDCLRAAEFLLQTDREEFRGVRKKKIWVIGASAGGHLALMTGLRLPPDRVAGILSISGIATIRPDYEQDKKRYWNLFGHEPTERELNALEPSSWLTPNSPPVLLTHDRKDNVVPIRSAELFLEKLREKRIPATTFFYEKPETGYSHRIWIPGSNPHKLYPELEEVLGHFIAVHREKN